MDLSIAIFAIMALLLVAYLVLSENARTVVADILKHPTESTTIKREGDRIEVVSRNDDRSARA